MKKTLITLALFALALTGCVVDSGRDYGDRRWNNGDHAEFRAEQGQPGYGLQGYGQQGYKQQGYWGR